MEFTTFQEVVDADPLVTSTSPPHSVDNSRNDLPVTFNNLNSNEEVDMSYYYYDYPSVVQFSNVLTPSQMATDAFEGDMNAFEGSNKVTINEEDYYYDGPVYLDDEAQVSLSVIAKL